MKTLDTETQERIWRQLQGASKANMAQLGTFVTDDNADDTLNTFIGTMDAVKELLKSGVIEPEDIINYDWIIWEKTDKG